MVNLISEAISEIENRANENTISGIPSGFIELDRLTDGWQKSNLYVLGSRPGIGKTTLALNFARNAAVDFNKSVAIFSLEMTSLQLTNRLISYSTEIPLNKIITGNIENHEFVQLSENIKNLSVAPINIDDNSNYTINSFLVAANALIKEKEIDLIIIDNLQLFKEESTLIPNREQQLSNIVRLLKSFAKESKIPIILLSQLNRQVENRFGDKRPHLNDLRDSGAIEDVSDMVMFIHRPEFYGIEFDENNQPTKNKVEIIIAKNRHGIKTGLALKFTPQYFKVDDLIQIESNLNDKKSAFLYDGTDAFGDIIKRTNLDEVF